MGFADEYFLLFLYIYVQIRRVIDSKQHKNKSQEWYNNDISNWRKFLKIFQESTGCWINLILKKRTEK